MTGTSSWSLQVHSYHPDPTIVNPKRTGIFWFSSALVTNEAPPARSKASHNITRIIFAINTTPIITADVAVDYYLIHYLIRGHNENSGPYVLYRGDGYAYSIETEMVDIVAPAAEVMIA
jgi:hypothetical protein